MNAFSRRDKPIRIIKGPSASKPEGEEEHTRAVLEAGVVHSLKPISAGLGVLYAVFTIIDLMTLPEELKKK